MRDAVQTDGGASFWCSGAGTFLRVQPVGGCLFVGCHCNTCPIVAGGSKEYEVVWAAGSGKIIGNTGFMFFYKLVTGVWRVRPGEMDCERGYLKGLAQ